MLRTLLLLTLSWCTASRTFLPSLLSFFAASSSPRLPSCSVAPRSALFSLSLFDISSCERLLSELNLVRLPSSLLFSSSLAMDSMQGLPSQAEFDAFKDSVLREASRRSRYLRSQQEEDHARACASKGLWKQAIQNHHPVQGHKTPFWARALQARACLEEGLVAKAREIVAEIAEDRGEEAQGWAKEVLKEVVRMLDEMQVEPRYLELKEKLKLDCEDLPLKMKVAEMALDREEYDLAVTLLLDVFEINKDSAAKAKLLEAFKKIGSGSIIVKEGRQRLGRILY